MTCLTAATHYLYQCWLIVDGILWHSIEDTSTCIAKDTKRKCLEIWLYINGIFQYIRTRSSVCFITYTFLKTTSLQISNSCAKNQITKTGSTLSLSEFVYNTMVLVPDFESVACQWWPPPPPPPPPTHTHTHTHTHTRTHIHIYMYISLVQLVCWTPSLYLNQY